MAGKNGTTFRRGLGKWAKTAGDQLDGLARQACLNLSEAVVRDTPVDTGFLRGSWQPALGQPRTKGDAAQDQSGAGAISEIGLTVAGMKAGDRFYMRNNAAYALRQEFGFVGEDSLGRSYNQAGRFFVTNNIKRWRQHVSAAAISLGLKP